ncbi:MAG TPA: transcriptional regulator FtrA [Vicinamibacterales bacterium]|nr:transcriptional regulator FtrA [Vicinamibacterales bacterium]
MRARHHVVAVAYDRLCTFEFGIVTEAFALPRPELNVPWYRFSVCSIDTRPLRATGGITVRATRGLAALRRADTIVIPGWRDADEPPPDELLAALRRAYQRGARVLSICSGVFVLAAAGLLDGRRATTHWRYAERLSARYPKVRVEPDVLYIDEGRVLTSAGSAAGIDLCLHVIRKDFGARIANQVARRLVVPPHRDGGQAQFIPSPVPQDSTRGLASLTEWVQTNLHRRLTVDVLAKQARMSPRSFARRFRDELGTTPHRWIAHQRLLAAQHRLETGDESIDRVAEAIGLQTAATLRQHFQQRLGTSPSAYRRRFTVRSSLRARPK